VKKIALLGSAPSSVQLAPFDDPTWNIWACSPGARPHARRVDAWFEIHLWEPHQPWFHRDYVDFMASLPCPVYMLEHVPAIPNSTPFPKDAVLGYVYGEIKGADGIARPARFNPNDFGSSLSWMLALAIMQQPDEIGLWGVDMAAGEEYGPQKDGCLALIHVARSIGIKVTVPPESDLLRPVPLYGFREQDPMFIKLSKRIEELQGRLNAAEAKYQEGDRERWYFKGALEDALYTRQTWVSDPQAIDRMYANPEPRPVPIEEPPPSEVAMTKGVNGEIPAMAVATPKRRKANGAHPEASA
jgi:hypothetical protein